MTAALSAPPWIAHDGSDVCPVPDGHDVEVRYDDNYLCRELAPTDRSWGAITHYRDWTAFAQASEPVGEVDDERAKIIAWLRADQGGRGLVAYRDCWNIAAMLERGEDEPAPVDPFLYEARAIVVDCLAAHELDEADEVLAGGWDKGFRIAIALAALRRGADIAARLPAAVAAVEGEN